MDKYASNATILTRRVDPTWSIYDIFFSYVFYCTGVPAIIINLYLIYLIIAKSPKTLHTYRVFLLNVALGDLLFALSTTFAQIRIIPNKWAFAYIPLGLSRYLGAHFSYFIYCVQLHSLFYAFLCFPLSFGFRYYVLVKPMPSIGQCMMLCFSLWLVAFGQHVLFIFSESPTEEIRDYLSVNKPLYNLTGWEISGNHMINSPLTSITLATIVLPMFPIYVLVMFFYKKVQMFLHENSKSMREGTIRGHKKLLKALTIQASLPLLFIFPPITIYGLYHLEFIDFTIIEYLVYTIFSFLPAISPMVTLYFVRPYNEAVKKLFGQTIKVMPSGISQTDKNTRYSISQPHSK